MNKKPIQKRTKKAKFSKVDVRSKKRLTVLLASSFILLFALTIRISYLQFAPTVGGRNLSDEAQRQQLAARTIQARRGNLLDANGRGLAFSVEVDTISVNPNGLRTTAGEEVDKEDLAKVFSDIFELEFEEVLYKLDSDSTSVTIVERAEHAKTSELRRLDT